MPHKTNFSRVSPLIGVGFAYKGHDVVASLDRACKRYGKPERIRVDNGPEFISKELDLWAYLNKVVVDFSRPGKPTDNAFIESFNGRFRDECPNQHWFLSLEDAQTKIEDWGIEYNAIRPHSSIGRMSPEQFLKDGYKTSSSVESGAPPTSSLEGSFSAPPGSGYR